MFFCFRMVFFYLVTTGWIFDISLRENLVSLQVKLFQAIEVQRKNIASD